MKVIGVIPARYGAERLSAKPLLNKTGKYLIQHVYEQVIKARKLDEVIVATDDHRILDAVKSFGGKAVMTSRKHTSGTERAAEVANRINCSAVINIQGDEPEIEPHNIDILVDIMCQGEEYATLAVPFKDTDDLTNPNKVKVVLDRDNYALYFSRLPIPSLDCKSMVGRNNFRYPLLHLGIYGYSKRFLLKFAKMPHSLLEKAERLEQLRALENGYNIKVGIVRSKGFGGIDTAGRD